MLQNRKIKFLLASLAVLIMLGGVILSLDRPPNGSPEIAHHMAPNTNSVDIGNLNEDMVHHGIELGAMPEAPDIGSGNSNRQLWETPPPMP